MKKLLFVGAILAGCAATPKLDENAGRQIRASISPNEGEVRFSSVGIWLPNSKEFKFAVPEPSVKGVVVITEHSIIFQQWGGPNGFTVSKRIPFRDVLAFSMITFGASGRVVIRTNGDVYDSFAVSDGGGEVSIRSGTTDLYQVLLALIKI